MPDKSNYSILIVEDNPGDFELIEEFLREQMGTPAITHAQNYKEAKASLSDEKINFNIILLDLSLPDRTGARLIEDIVYESNNVPVIVLTGYDDFAFGVKSISLGVSDYILKDELTSLTLYKTIIYSLERRKIVSSLEESEKRVRSFARQMSEVVEEERARIAREIHDEFGQQLSGIKMSLSALKKSTRTQTDMEPIIETIVNEVNHSIQSLRQISNELRPALLDKLGLLSAIEWLVKEFQKKTGIDSHFSANGDQPVISKDVEINIFRICQEALTNITKHACATLLNVAVLGNGDTFNIKITDNGKGINAGVLRDPLSMGLLNMRERANLINAGLHISSSTDAGTMIELIVNTNGKENINS
jgi:signal transduction histidine kinase